MTTIYTINNKVLTNDSKWLTESSIPPTPVFPYQTITIGNRIWFMENLHETDDGSGIYVVNNVSANGVDYGTQYFYNQAAAIRIANAFAQTYEGWRLPSETDFNNLASNAGGTGHTGFLALASTTGWNDSLNGNDTIGFNGYPVGQYTDGSHNNNGFECHFWSSNSSIRLMLSLYTDNGISEIGWESSDKGYSVRLVKDVT